MPTQILGGISLIFFLFIIKNPRFNSKFCKIPKEFSHKAYIVKYAKNYKAIIRIEYHRISGDVFISKNQFFGSYKGYDLSYVKLSGKASFFQVKAKNGNVVELMPYPMRSMTQKDIMAHFDDLKGQAFHLFAEMIGENEKKIVRELGHSHTER